VVGSRAWSRYPRRYPDRCRGWPTIEAYGFFPACPVTDWNGTRRRLDGSSDPPDAWSDRASHRIAQPSPASTHKSERQGCRLELLHSLHQSRSPVECTSSHPSLPGAMASKLTGPSTIFSRLAFHVRCRATKSPNAQSWVPLGGANTTARSTSLPACSVPLTRLPNSQSSCTALVCRAHSQRASRHASEIYIAGSL
jgi:hypothetical protein